MESKFPKAKAHPWHGISPGDNVPETVTCFIEIVPGDTIKYEIDKASGYLKIDRPQQYSNVAPLPNWQEQPKVTEIPWIL
jgi:inorganic pyrophosphatase